MQVPGCLSNPVLGYGTDGTFLELGYVTDDMFGAFKMALARHDAEAGECHDGSGNVNTSDGDCPLQ